MHSFAVISKATKLYYDAVVSDDRLHPIFRHVNVTVLRYHVALMLNMIMNDQQPITREQLADIKDAHDVPIRCSGATQYHFDLMMEHLDAAMTAVGADSRQMIERLAPVRGVFPKHAAADGPGVCLPCCRLPQSQCWYCDMTKSRPSRRVRSAFTWSARFWRMVVSCCRSARSCLTLPAR